MGLRGAGDSGKLGEVALFLWLGIGTLLPWNAFITASSYFQHRFQGGPFEDTFESAFGLAYNASNLVALLLLLAVQQFLSESVLITGPYLLTAAIFFAMAVLAVVDVSSGRALFEITMMCVLSCGLLAAPMIAGVTGLASTFPRDCSSSFFSGQALAGVMASLVSLLTTVSSPLKPDFCGNGTNTSGVSYGGDAADAPFAPDWSAFWYFFVAAAVCALSVAAYVGVKALRRRRSDGAAYEGSALNPALQRAMLAHGVEEALPEPPPRNPFGASSVPNPFVDAASLHEQQQERRRQQQQQQLLLQQPQASEEYEYSINLHDSLEEMERRDAAAALLEQQGGGAGRGRGESVPRSEASAEGLDYDEYNRRVFNRLPAEESWSPSTIRMVADITQKPCLAVLVTFWVTLSVFPAVTADTQSSRRCQSEAGRFWNDLFVPMLFLCFNLSDLLGRLLQARWQPLNGKGLLRLSLARLLLLPVFWGLRVRKSRLTPIFANDSLPFIASLLAGFSNGFCATASMVHASRLVPPQHRGVTATLAVTALTLGLMLGSLSSFGTMWIIQG